MSRYDAGASGGRGWVDAGSLAGQSSTAGQSGFRGQSGVGLKCKKFYSKVFGLIADAAQARKELELLHWSTTT